ncbi:DEAD/DEAH box helicase [Cysteiniphilum sp. 6C5]|uniref:DEAD/DEAH box helicase n=1 Tax=unclassified Cysteiniphilum TaxID=2610889 RepID=UPI003F832641
MLEFHRREAKPVFWRLFERLGLSHLELMDDLDCLAYCQRTDREPFKPTPKARNLAYEYSFDPSQEFKGVQKQFYILGFETANGKTQKVTFIPEESNLQDGIIVLQSNQEPPKEIALVPDEFVNAEPIPKAINRIVLDYEMGRLKSNRSAIIDFLTRSKPRITGGVTGSIASSNDPKEKLQQIIQAISKLDNSYLTIQGPPGTGKSYTAKNVITELLKSDARIGIASNSHKAINHLLLNAAKHCHALGVEATFVCTKDTDSELAHYNVTIVQNKDLVSHVKSACVIGTTAWGFARDEMEDQLDYLFVDEAGQVAVANLIAISQSAKNLVLMGDQMQLGQPSQGTHPADSGLSILDYLLHETPTIPDDMGVFLNTTYRMHSGINRFISKHIYEGKLAANPDNDKRIIEVPIDYSGPLNKEAGIIYIPVNHEGNTQASDEEVDEIKKLAESLLGRTFHTGVSNPKTRKISWNDMLFVAPYNHQVNKLRSALGDQAKIGSVDKFQGQEAPIVFLSMCASDANESPRGLGFLFDKHRINVAISRAQSLTIIVANPNLAKTTVNTVEQVKLVNLFSAIISS